MTKNPDQKEEVVEDIVAVDLLIIEEVIAAEALEVVAEETQEEVSTTRGIKHWKRQVYD